MSSIATKHGDAGSTGLIGGVRTSKADPRVESYGDVDELNSCLGFARSICSQADIRDWTEDDSEDAVSGWCRVGYAASESEEGAGTDAGGCGIPDGAGGSD